LLAATFSTTVVTTNQQGIGKGFYTEEDLHVIHRHMRKQIKLNGGRIDKVYFCPSLALENSECRKPNTEMALQAKANFPAIAFSRSVMVGVALRD
jgi:D-glycero-D-manno-heptose 1,7-bisphosphate phosphatase